MRTQLDASEFVDNDFQAAPARAIPSPSMNSSMNPNRAPTREEVDQRVGEMQQKLSELKRAQSELERERATLEETRRRQVEFTTGRQEMLQNLTRGIGLLEEAEFAHRREAEQMAKSLTEFREVLGKIQSIREETWSQDQLGVELTRAVTAVDNARMEWNSARLKFPILSESKDPSESGAGPRTRGGLPSFLLEPQDYAQLCKLGLAITWPLVLAGLAIFVVLLLRH